VQGKYELCLTELAKVHELIPQYENSKELQSFCEQGKELVHRQRDLERKERERAMIEQQITGYVEACKARLTVDSTVEETRQCLAEAMELDPEHALISEMIHTAQMHEEERKFMKAQKEEQEKKTAKGMAQYHKARSLYKKGQLSKALAAYDDFIETPYPNIENQKAVARREVASIKKELKVKVDTLYAKCKELGGSQKYKEAYLACDDAVKEDPSQNEAKEYRDQMHLELKRGMKNIYEDSVLEESLGNVDSAKEKWRRIMKEDLDFDEYTVKAKSKLQKYGVLD
jgi:tetratricopeptide (TPR) repeat protein